MVIPVPKTLKEGSGNHRLFMALRSGVPKSHKELYRSLDIMVHSRASELRHKHGCLIETWQEGRTTWYQLRSVGTVPQAGSTGTDGSSATALPPVGPPEGQSPAELSSTSEPAASTASPLPEARSVQPQKQLEIWSAAA
jgi:hypothetical protein